MLNNEDLFNQTIIEIEKLWTKNKRLSNFVNWPKSLVLTKKPINEIKVTKKLSSWKSKGSEQVNKIHNLITNLAPYVNWDNGYREDQVSKEFLDKYGFFELIGPTGHYETSEMALYVNFLDQNAYYPWHNHEAEELYFIVSGKAKFECKDQNIEILSSTKTRLHKSFQPHAITTIENQVLSFVIWKNKFENVSKMIKG